MSLGNFEHVYIVVCIIFAGPESHVIRRKAQVVNDLLSFAVLLYSSFSGAFTTLCNKYIQYSI